MHPLSSEQNQTPYQLWTCGVQMLADSSALVAVNMFEELTQVYLLLNIVMMVLQFLPAPCNQQQKCTQSKAIFGIIISMHKITLEV